MPGREVRVNGVRSNKVGMNGAIPLHQDVVSVGSVKDDEGAVRIDVNRSTVVVDVAIGLDDELADLQVDVAAEVIEAWLLILVEQINLEFVPALERPRHIYPI